MAENLKTDRIGKMTAGMLEALSYTVIVSDNPLETLSLTMGKTPNDFIISD